MAALKPLKKLEGLKPLKPVTLPPSTLGEPEGETPEDSSRADHIKMMRGLCQAQAQANELANDTGYWFAAYFQTVEQRNVYLESKGLATDSMYVDGLDLADADGVLLPVRTGRYKVGDIDRKCAALAREQGD